MDSELAEVLDLLGIVEHYIQSIGDIAAPKTVVEVVPHSKSGKRYARKRIPVDGRNTFKGCGLEGSEQHQAVIASVQRRHLLEKAQDLIVQVEEWRKSEDWQGLKRTIPASPEASAPVEKPESPPPALPTEIAETNLISFGFKGGKGATVDNRVVHAIPGAPPHPFGLWYTPALCGAEPNLAKLWGWVGDCTIMFLSCRKCEKKLAKIQHSIKLPSYLSDRSRGVVIDLND
ncbi:MAG: hypothetical protein AAFO02_13120 [Bacteroidota bacterium]